MSARHPPARGGRAAPWPRPGPREAGGSGPALPARRLRWDRDPGAVPASGTGRAGAATQADPAPRLVQSLSGRRRRALWRRTRRSTPAKPALQRPRCRSLPSRCGAAPLPGPVCAPGTGQPQVCERSSSAVRGCPSLGKRVRSWRELMGKKMTEELVVTDTVRVPGVNQLLRCCLL